MLCFTSLHNNNRAKTFLFISTCALNLLVLHELFKGSATTTVQQEHSNNSAVAVGITTSSSVHGCVGLDFEEEMDIMIMNSKPIFITMPAKAAGTSMKSFNKKCMKREIPDNIFQKQALIQNFFTTSLKLPSVVTSHVLRDAPLVRLAKSSTRKTLIVYLHRNETDRLKSGIKEVLKVRICDKTHKKKHVDTKGFRVQLTAEKCIVPEELVTGIIRQRQYEVKYGAQDILSCNVFDAIKEHGPNFIFLDYKQANKLQRLVSKHHCPELLEKPVEENLSAEKTMKILLQPENGSRRLMELDTWLDAKIGLTEWAYRLKDDASCQRILKSIDRDLSSCPDRAFKVTSSYIKKLW